MPGPILTVCCSDAVAAETNVGSVSSCGAGEAHTSVDDSVCCRARDAHQRKAKAAAQRERRIRGRTEPRVRLSGSCSGAARVSPAAADLQLPAVGPAREPAVRDAACPISTG
jgi:hypothetical protein